MMPLDLGSDNLLDVGDRSQIQGFAQGEESNKRDPYKIGAPKCNTLHVKINEKGICNTEGDSKETCLP